MELNHPILYEIPLWSTAVIILGGLWLSVEASYRIGLWQRRAGRARETDRRGDVVLTSMLGFLGLMLAFTYSFTIGRSDNRKTALIDEVNALSTAFLRADLLDEPHRTELQRVLLDYLRTRRVSKKERLKETIADTLLKQSQIWPTTVEIVNSDDSPNVIHSLIVQANNEVLDAHTKRVMAGFDVLPSEILIILIFVASASLGVAGYSAGRADSLQRWRMTALTLVLSAVMLVIIDFDQPLEGFVQLDQSAFLDLIQEMEATLAGRD